MKIWRVLLIAAASLVVVLVIATVLVFNSGFQTWIARKAVAAQPDLKADIGRVSVGLNQVELTSVKVTQPGLILTLPSASIDVSVLKAASKKVEVKRLTAHGWTLDLTAPQKVAGARVLGRQGLAGYVAVLGQAQAAPATQAEAFQGIFSQLKLPVDLAVDAVDLAGEVIFPMEPGQPAGRARVTITGGQLAAGREGSFVVTADAGLAGAVTSLSSRSQIGVRMDTPSSIDRVSVKMDAKAVGTQFPQGAALQLDLNAERRSGGTESYVALIKSAGKSLVDLQAQLPLGAKKLEGKVLLSMQDSDLTPFALGRPLPAFTAKADSAFGVDTQFTQFQANGTLDLVLSKLEVIQKELASLGVLRVNATFAAEQVDSLLRVSTLQARVDGEKPVAVIDVRQAFEYNLETSELRGVDTTRDLVAISLEGVPLAWAQPFLSNMSLSGGEARGAFIVKAAGGGFSVRAQAPLTVSTFSLAQDGAPLLKDIALSVSPSADVTPQGWQAELADFAVRSGTVKLLSLAAKAGQVSGQKEPIKATGTFAVDLPGVLAQPAAGGAVVLNRGAASGQFTASSGEKQEVAAQMVFSDLVSGQEAFPKVSLDVRADLGADGKFAAQVPIQLEKEGRNSDVQLEAKGTQTAAGVEVNARVTSTMLHVDDVKILGAPFAGASSEQPVSSPPNTPDNKPIWAGIKGQLTLALQQVVYSPELIVKDINGSVSISEAAVTLEALKAVLGTGGQVAVNGGLTFTPVAKQPYTLKADVAVTNLDSGATLKAFKSGDALPLVEGKFDLTTKVAASGASLDALADQARGDVRITSKGGLFRPVPSNYVDALSSARTQLLKRTEQAGAISSLAGALGAKLPGNLGGATAKVQAVAERLGELEAVVKLISEVKFDQLTFDAGSDSNLDTILRDLTITSPELRFVGAGGLKYQPDVPLWKQALSLRLNGAARGKAAEAMKKANLLGDSVDALGYIPLTLAVNVDGTAEKPDTSKLVAALIEKVLALKMEPGDLERIRQGDIASLLNLLTQLK